LASRSAPRASCARRANGQAKGPAEARGAEADDSDQQFGVGRQRSENETWLKRLDDSIR
jgi:hypothetical protein